MRSTIIFFLLTLSVSIVFSQPTCDFRGRDSLHVVIVGDTVNIWDMAACTYCANLTISVSRSADSIYILQTNPLATCGCIVDLRTSITGLTLGTFWAVIYRVFPFPTPIRRFVGSVQFQFAGTTSGNLASNSFQSGCLAVSVNQPFVEVPSQFALLQNYPNPFNPQTTLRYQTLTTEFVSIKVFDIIGREVQTLVEETKPPGFYVVSFEPPMSASSGVYFCQMVAGPFVETRVMVLLR